MILFLKIFAFWAFTTLYVATINRKIHPYVLRFFEGSRLWEKFIQLVKEAELDLELEFSIFYTLVYGIILLTIFNLVTKQA